MEITATSNLNKSVLFQPASIVKLSETEALVSEKLSEGLGVRDVSEMERESEAVGAACLS